MRIHDTEENRTAGGRDTVAVLTAELLRYLRGGGEELRAAVEAGEVERLVAEIKAHGRVLGRRGTPRTRAR